MMPKPSWVRLSGANIGEETEDEGWRPIETAPKDGTDVLLYYPYGRMEQGFHFEGVIEGFWFSSPKQIDDGWDTALGSFGDPTHWMPLPKPPGA